MRIKATHQQYGALTGTLDIIPLSEHEHVFALYADNVYPKPLWDIPLFTIEQPTLSALVAEAERQGLSDIEPV